MLSPKLKRHALAHPLLFFFLFFFFLHHVFQHYEVVLFTASHELYADPLLNTLDPEQKFIQCVFFKFR